MSAVFAIGAWLFLIGVVAWSRLRDVLRDFDARRRIHKLIDAETHAKACCDRLEELWSLPSREPRRHA